jgi:serine/threonine protein kinase
LFRREDDAGTLGAVLKGSVPPPSSLSDVDEVLDEILFKAMRRDPLERYETAADFADALEVLDQAASAEEVAACVEDVLGERLEQRRELIRIAVEQPNAEWSLDTGESHSSTSANVSVRSRVTQGEATPTVFDQPPSPPADEKDTIGPPRSKHLLAASFENNRARRLLAALMLLLVGSALGLLLSSQNSEKTPKKAPENFGPN